MKIFGKYNILDTPELLKQADEFLMDGDTPRFELIALDSETNGLDLYKTVVIGFSFSTDSKSGFYVPLLFWVPDVSSEKTKTLDKVKRQIYEHGVFVDVWRPGKQYQETVSPKEYQPPEFVKKYMKRWFSNVSLLLHNAPFDINQIFVNFQVDLSDQLFLDTILLAHIINENTPNGLKDVAQEWAEELGFNPFVAANIEQRELGETVIRNGGTYNARTKHVWRADKDPLGKYAVADTFLTFGIYEVGMQKFIAEFGEEMLDWLLVDEVMPLCREVVVQMKRKGVYIDVPYFTQLQKDVQIKLESLEDEIIAEINPFLKDFSIGKSLDEAVSERRVIKKIMELEGISSPKKIDKKTGEAKETLAKADVKKHYETNPHWLWGYILGEDEIKYSSEKMAKIKADLYQEILKRRYHFNIRSDYHLRWLFCEKLGMDKSKLPQTDSGTKSNPIPSMDAETLEEHMLPRFVWVKKLMLYNKLDKLQGTYINGALNLNQDGWLYMEWKQNGTDSGRFSCSGGFNLQTLPVVEELGVCNKCGHKHVKITHPIPILANTICPQCGHKEHDVLCSSAIKRGFIAPPGYKIANADFSALEPRIFSFMSGDNKLKEIYWKNLDFYSKIYCDQAGIPYFDLKKEGKKDERDDIKRGALAGPYGARGPQIANLLDFKKKKKYKDRDTGRFIEKEVLDVDRGWDWLDRYFKAFPDLKLYMDKQHLQCITEGSAKTLIGRRRHYRYAPFVYELLSAHDLTIDEFLDVKYSELQKYNPGCGLSKEGLEIFCKKYNMDFLEVMEKGAWAYVRELFKKEYNGSCNYPIQGLAGHICNRAMIEITREFKKAGLDAWICMQIHDELTVYVMDGQGELAISIQKKSMENNKYTALLDIPIIAEPIICNNLKDSK